MRCGICLLFNINIDADSVDLDQTAPKGAAWSASTMFVYKASKVFSKQQQGGKSRGFCLDTLYGCSNTLYGHSDRM